MLQTSFEMDKAQLPPRGASSLQRQTIGLGAVVCCRVLTTCDDEGA